MAIYSPIWKDNELSVNLTTADTYLSYYITVEESGIETTIFNGKVFPKPSYSAVVLNVNKVCQDYLSSDLPDLNNISTMTSYSNADAVKIFRVYKDTSTLLGEYVFLYDWSYEDWSGETKTLSNPINDHTADNMFGFYTTYANSAVTTVITPNAGSGCGEYALYYLNSNGGWDSFLIEGNVKKKDGITAHTYKRNHNNTKMEFEDNRYISEISTSYELVTNWLSDDESENLAKNLLESNKVYLHHLTDGKIIPVIIEDTSISYKRFKTEGSLVNYTINVRESQTKFRK